VAAFPSGDSITKRAKFLRTIGDSIITKKVISDKNVIFKTNKIKLVTEGYFLLNEAYKKWRIKNNHNTQAPKIAALTCMAIGTFQPFVPTNPANAKTIQQARCNEIYALACASVIIGMPLLKDKKDIYFRLLDVLSKCDSETIQPYLLDKSLSNDRELKTYKFEIHETDKLQIDSLITIFEMALLAK
jgi:hypothetical protein